MTYINIDIPSVMSLPAAATHVKGTRGRWVVIALDYALLGLLARAPSSGYDLIRNMEEPVGFFWHARRSQIYPALADLERAGLVTHETVTQEERPNKKVYQITEAGRAELARWVTTPLPRPKDRDEFMLKVYSIWLADPGQAADLIHAHEEHHARRLELYEAKRADMERAWGPELRRIMSPRFASYATLRRGIEYERGYVEWCRWLAGALDAGMSEGHSLAPG